MLWKLNIVRTYKVSAKASVGEPSCWFSVGEISTVRQKIALENGLDVVVVSGVGGGVSEHEDGRSSNVVRSSCWLGRL